MIVLRSAFGAACLRRSFDRPDCVLRCLALAG